MEGLLFRTAIILWMAQIVCTTGYGANFGVSNGQAFYPQANKAQNGGGANGMMNPSRSHKAGVHKGYGTYPSKSQDPTAGVSSSNGANPNGYGVAAGLANGGAMNGYGPAGHVTNGGKMKGYGAAAGTVNGQDDRSQGHRPEISAGVANGQQLKGYGAAGVLAGNGQRGVKGPGRAGKPMKGYGNPIYGAGRGVGLGNPGGAGAPQPNRHQGKAYGHHGYRGQPLGGYNGHAGLSLGPRYGNKGFKGPQQGSRVVAGQGSRQNGYAGGRHGGHGAVPNGYGYTQGGNTKPLIPAFGSYLNNYGNTNKGYGGPTGGAARPHPGFTAGSSAQNGPSAKPNGPGVMNGAALGGFGGFGSMPNGKDIFGTSSNGNGFKGGVPHPPQPSAVPHEADAHQQALSQGKGYKQTPIIPQALAEPKIVFSQGIDPMAALDSTPQPALTGLEIKPQEETSPGAGMVDPQSNDDTSETRSNQGYVTGSAAPENKSTQTDLVGLQSTADMGASSETVIADSLPAVQSQTTEVSVTKGQGRKSDCGPSGAPNGQWMKIRPGFNSGAAGSIGTQTKGYGAGAGVQNRYGAKHNGYGQGPNVGAAYGPKNRHNTGVQPNYAGLAQSEPTTDAKPGMPQLPFNGYPMVPAGLDGMSHFKPQSAGLPPNGKSNMYGGMGGLPFGGQAAGMGVEKSSKKYGIGGLQFGGQPYNAGNGGAPRFGYAGGPYGPVAQGKSFGKYGHGSFPSSGQHFGLGANGPIPGQYGYGRIPYEAQPDGLSHEYKLPENYGQPEASEHGQTGQVGRKHDGDSLPFETLPSEPDAVGTLFGEQPTQVEAVEGEGKSLDNYAPSLSPSSASIVSDVVTGVEDIPDSTDQESAQVTDSQGVTRMKEQTEDVQQMQLPRQINIKQQLKLHFHPEGAKNNKFDLNKFFGNGGIQDNAD